MKQERLYWLVLFATCVLILTGSSALAQVSVREGGVATLNTAGSAVRWDVKTPFAIATLTVTTPDGRSFSREFKGGTIDFSLVDNDGLRLPDGSYTYELRVSSVLPSKKKSEAALRRDDEPEAQRAARRPNPVEGSFVQSGSFSILNGTVIVPGAMVEPSRRIAQSQPLKKLFLNPQATNFSKEVRHHRVLAAMFDQVIPDDLIVQGSICAGIDCVNNENFGFDTIRVKENNTRIQFDDTSTSAGFPTNNWQIRANSSASGGASFLAFVDQGDTGNSETGTILFEVDAGAPANSLKVASNGKIGLRTATPVLDLHIDTSDTPAMRFEQNNGGGFTAQTWDIAGNEASFFIRDVTGGSRLPFRIRPGAPNSSIDIAASGNVGISTASPETTLDVSGNTILLGSDPDSTTRTSNVAKLTRLAVPPFVAGNLNFGAFVAATTAGDNIAAVGGAANGMSAATRIVFQTAITTNTAVGTERMRITENGRVGIGTPFPDQLLSVNGEASKVGGGSWQTFSDERLKNISGPFTSGLKAVMRLQPLRYQYRPNNPVGIVSEGEHIGVGAQAVQKVIPEAVTANANGYLMVNNDPIIWTMLNAIKEQQAQIEELKREVKRLKARKR